MAKDDSTPRVYKASDVHKRRAEKKPRSKDKKGEDKPVAEGGSALEAGLQEKPAVQEKPDAKSNQAPKARPSIKGKPVAEGKPAASMASSLTEPIGAPVAEGSSETKRPVSPAAETRPIVVPSDESFSSRLKSDDPDEGVDGEGDSADGKPKKKRWKLRVGIGIAVLLVVALAAGAAVLSWDRWMRYDDAADMQGTWYAYGTSVPVTFVDGQIVFDANTAYSYEIDPDAKTIRYQIGDLEGQGRYWFSGDRGALVITDGDGYDKWKTVLEDLGFWFGELFHGASLPMGETSIAFSRVPMNDGLLVAPESKSEAEPAPTPESESSSAAPAEPEPEPEQPADQGRDAKDDMKQMPISDIIIEDNTPTWGESDE